MKNEQWKILMFSLFLIPEINLMTVFPSTPCWTPSMSPLLPFFASVGRATPKSGGDSSVFDHIWVTHHRQHCCFSQLLQWAADSCAENNRIWRERCCFREAAMVKHSCFSPEEVYLPATSLFNEEWMCFNTECRKCKRCKFMGSSLLFFSFKIVCLYISVKLKVPDVALTV